MSEEELQVLKDIRRWLKLSTISDARVRLEEAVSADSDEVEEENKIIFHLTDGSRGANTISEYVSVSHDTVNSRQSAWAEMGLLEKPGPTSPYRKLLTLEEAGFDIPDIPDLDDDDE